MLKSTENNDFRNLFGARSFKKLLFATAGAALMLPLSAQADPLAYVVNGATQNISVIDAATNTVVETIAGVGATTSVAIDFTQDGSIAYIANFSDNTVSVFDVATSTITSTIPVGVNPSDVEFTPDDSFAYVSNRGSENVSVIETATKSVVATVGAGTGPFGVEITPDGNFAYVPNVNSSDITVIDTSSNNVVATIMVGGRPRHLAFTSDSSLAYAPSADTNKVFVIDTATNTIVRTIPVGLSPRDVAITPDGNFAYVLNTRGNSVSVIDMASNTVTATIPGVPIPFGLSVAPDGSPLYVSNIFANSVTVIDTASNTVTATIAVGGEPRDIAFRPEAANEKPIAAAGVDQAIRAGDTVSLDGSASFDDNTDSTALAYSWSFVNQPVGSATTLTDAMTATPSFVADLTGTYDVSLVVTDEGGLDSDADSVSVSSDNLAPTAIAGEGQLVILGANIYLDGSGSNDPEMDPLSFAWSLTSPAGSSAALNDATSVTPVFTADVEGTYSARLTVSDFLGAGTPDSVEIVAASNSDFAVSKIMDTNIYMSGLPSGDFTTDGNRNAFGKFLRQATSAIQKGKPSSAIKKLEKAIERTDGCALNGTPDTNNKRDWITSCDAQAVVHACLTEALEALQNDTAGAGQGQSKKEKKAKKAKK